MWNLTQNEADLICKGLEQVKDEFEVALLSLCSSDEIFIWQSSRLIEIIGEVGKKLHTARSRNDQVALDFKLFVCISYKHLRILVLKSISTLLIKQKTIHNFCLCGYYAFTARTTCEFWLFTLCVCLYVCKRCGAIIISFKRNNYCPLGVAALAGTPYSTDRHFVAKKTFYCSHAKCC